MKDYRNVVLINSFEIINVVRHALSKIDPRLINHGERVGYIAKQIYDNLPDKADFDFSKLFILCALHDIGAYKTNEVDDMVKFEIERPFDHSLYGYVFLKNTAHLEEFAEALLYHHTDYTEVEKSGYRNAKYAEIIYLADRADILIHTPNTEMSVLKSLSGKKFRPEYVDALFRAEEKTGFIEKMTSGDISDEINDILTSLDVKNSEIMDYLKLLVYAIDFISPYTVTHTADTTIISVQIAKLMGIPEKEIQPLYIGSFLHDIGKIAIPYTILEKPAKLTDEEFTIIKTHINEGEAILRGVVSDEICDIALRHHEKLNGGDIFAVLRQTSLPCPNAL